MKLLFNDIPQELVDLSALLEGRVEFSAFDRMFVTGSWSWYAKIHVLRPDDFAASVGAFIVLMGLKNVVEWDKPLWFYESYVTDGLGWTTRKYVVRYKKEPRLFYSKEQRNSTTLRPSIHYKDLIEWLKETA